MVRSLFLPSRWQASILSPEIFTPIWCRILQTVGSSWSCSTEEGMATTSTHSRREYCAFFQYWRSTELSCLTKASFTLFTTTISDSSFLKLRCISLISSIQQQKMRPHWLNAYNWFCFHRKRNDGRLLLINMVYTSCLTSCWTI